MIPEISFQTVLQILVLTYLSLVLLLVSIFYICLVMIETIEEASN